MYICHIEQPDEGGINQQTLYLPIPGAIAHLLQHDADYSGQCQEEEEPTPTPTPSPTPPIDECEEDCEEPTPTPTEEPIPTETPVVVNQPVGPAGPPAVPQCVEELKPAMVQGAERVDSDTVAFHWHPSTDNPSRQSFKYGYSQDNLPYSVLDFPGDVSEITVNDVASGVHVWGQVISYKEGCVSESNIFDP